MKKIGVLNCFVAESQSLVVLADNKCICYIVVKVNKREMKSVFSKPAKTKFANFFKIDILKNFVILT